MMLSGRARRCFAQRALSRALERASSSARAPSSTASTTAPAAQAQRPLPPPSFLKDRKLWRSLSTCALRADAEAGSPAPPPQTTIIGKILIANRGEIACRIIKTARRLGIRTVAVYSEADKHSLHVRMADEAVCIGPAPAMSSYLNISAILDAMRRTGAHAVHPGYGFVSENAPFAEACKQEGFTFIGPPTNAIRAMGDKSESKRLMSAAGVPVVPGYHGENQDAEFLKLQADKIGYPIIIKATQGGGGKGMKIVSRAEEFLENLYSAQREAQASFGDNRVLIEKYILEPRHIEVQVFGDKHGNVVHLFERDCSVQRRHQKIIEEAPAPNISDSFREHIGQAAVNAAKAVGYYNAGTVEFIVDSATKEFFFMEMNTRLQVEHPVTEMVTNQDLVEWQIRIASGEHLPCEQSKLFVSGHAFEARIYAENIESGFLPAAGVLHHYRPPDLSCNVRVETGVQQGDSVTIHYDPMIAKLVVWGHNRATALLKLQDCLSKFQISGLPTNVRFLKALAQHQAFSAGDVGTHFIEHHKESLLTPLQKHSSKDRKLAAAIAAACLSEKDLREACQASKERSWGQENNEGWNSLSGFRLNHQLECRFVFDVGQVGELEVTVRYGKDCTYIVKLQDGEEIMVRAEHHFENPNEFKVEVGGISQYISTSFYSQDTVDHVDIWHDGNHHEFSLPKHDFTASDQNLDLQGCFKEQKRSSGIPDGGIVAPMAGRITKILVGDRAAVKKGDSLVILEAMKMEHVVRAPKDGMVEGLKLKVGDHVRDNSLLLMIRDLSN